MPKLSAKGYTLKVSQARCTAVPCPLKQLGVGGCIWQRAHGGDFPGEAPTAETGLESFDEPTAVAPETLMTGTHSPWPLFCNDLDQAQQWVGKQLALTLPIRSSGTRP